MKQALQNDWPVAVIDEIERFVSTRSNVEDEEDDFVSQAPFGLRGIQGLSLTVFVVRYLV